MDKQEKRKNVINGLESFKADLKPFAGCHADWEKVDDALALLKAQEQEVVNLTTKIVELTTAQEPRVMTLEEVVENSELRVVWVERRNGDICAGIYEKCRNTAGGVCAVYFNFRHVPNNGMFSASSYNVSWRCWTSRPTDAQREAVKWE